LKTDIEAASGKGGLFVNYYFQTD